MFSFSAIYIVGQWLIRFVMVPVVMSRRRPTVATAWLLLIFLQPWVGLVVYMMVGENRLPRRRIKKHARMLEARRSLAALGRVEPHVVSPRIDPAHQGLVRLAQGLGEDRILGGNDVRFITDTTMMIEDLVEEIGRARHHVHLLYYIFEDSPAAKRVGEAMAAAVKRGVACRVLADSVGSWRMFRGLGAWMRQQGIQVVEMLPVNPFRRRFARLDLRNHRKLAIIDGHIAYTGSQNLSDPICRRGGQPWYEVTVRVTGPAVQQLQAVFIEDWYFDTDEVLDGRDIFPDPCVTGPVPLQTLPSGPTYPTENYRQFVIAAIHAAQRRVIITTPYLVPDEPLMLALQTAVLRGVRVQLIVPRQSDQRLTDLVGRAYYRSLLQIGVELYWHSDGVLHSKTLTVDDDLSLVGSSNFDIRSFSLNFELNLLLYGSDITQQLREIQEAYIHQSVPLLGGDWCNRNPAVHFVDGCAQLFSPLL